MTSSRRCQPLLISLLRAVGISVILGTLAASVSAGDSAPEGQVKVVDSRGSVIGTVGVTSCDPGGVCGPTQFVLRRERNVLFSLAYDPASGFIPTTDDLAYESTDCTGTPLVQNVPAASNDQLMLPTIVREPGCGGASRTLARYPLEGARTITIGSTRADYSCSPPTLCAEHGGTVLPNAFCCLPCRGSCRSSAAAAGILDLSAFTPPFTLQTR